ncbi:MAG: hypothetical protein H0T46_33185 [Deltaproteobacteria bacterium]|nr:hypothetical protein [Deltaproteobacteria bacterium]
MSNNPGRVWRNAAGLALLVFACGCRLGFDEPTGSMDASPRVCAAGERATLPGTWHSAATMAGSILVGYAPAADSALVVQSLGTHGLLQGLSLRLFSSGRFLELISSVAGPVTISFSTSEPDGWDQVFTTSMTSVGLLDAAPAPRTSTGAHSTFAVSTRRADQILVAYRREIPAVPSYHLMLDVYDQDWSRQASVTADLGLGPPLMLTATTTGYLLQTTQHVLPVSLAGQVSSGMSTAGYDQVSLVEGTPPEAPQLVPGHRGFDLFTPRP